jgi:Clustered mitochondria
MHAQAELPLAEGTLRIGSQDAGVTVLDHDPELRGKLRLVAAQLNLKPHLGRGLVQLQLGCDVEGHRGTDGNLYVVCWSTLCLLVVSVLAAHSAGAAAA